MRCFPVVVNNRCLDFYSAGKLWRSRSCRSSQVLVPCRCPEADSHGLPARKIMATPQCSIFSGGRCPCCGFAVSLASSRCQASVVSSLSVFFFWIMGGLKNKFLATFVDPRGFSSYYWSYGHSPSLSIWTPSRPVAVGRWSMCRSCLDMLVDVPVVFKDRCRGPDSGAAAAVF